MSAASGFDRHADTYDADLNQALSVSGEEKEFFARGRVQWLSDCLRRLGHESKSAIDYGCGIGDTSILLRELLGLKSVVGLEVSERSLEIAKSRHPANDCQFLSFAGYRPQADIDVVYCNGVFHHIPPAERPAAVDYVYRSLKPGGVFALWENNPWNPGTRYVMSQCVFDHDAVPIVPPEARRLLRGGGLRIISTDYLFFFPRFLKALRFSEPLLKAIPVGAQYQVLCRKER
jgi:SAM-dependent methyltransferase